MLYSPAVLYCPRCNNTHWMPVEGASLRALVRLKKTVKCGKCGKVAMGPLFMETGGPKRQAFVCPVCKVEARRSRRKGLERVMFFVRAYRCSSCKNRFRKFQLVG